MCCAVLCLVSQSCPTLCNPMHCKPTRLLSPWNFPGKNPGVGCHFFLQGIFLSQGLNPGLLHHKQILYHLSPQGSPSLDVNLSKLREIVKGSFACCSPQCPKESDMASRQNNNNKLVYNYRFIFHFSRFQKAKNQMTVKKV